MADAVIGWSVFEHWDPDRIQTVPLQKEQVPRIGYIPVAISTFTKDRVAAQRFIDFLNSQEAQAIYAQYHYFPTAESAEKWLGVSRFVGGEYVVPEDWLGNRINER